MIEVFEYTRNAVISYVDTWMKGQRIKKLPILTIRFAGISAIFSLRQKVYYLVFQNIQPIFPKHLRKTVRNRDKTFRLEK